MEFQHAVIGRALFEPAARIAECLGGVEAADANPAFSECFPHSRDIYVKRCIFGNSRIGHRAVSVRENRHCECAKQNERRPEAAIHLIANDHRAVAYGWHKDACTFSRSRKRKKAVW